MIQTTTWAEEDAAVLTSGPPNPDYCPHPCMGVSVLHRPHLSRPVKETNPS